MKIVLWIIIAIIVLPAILVTFSLLIGCVFNSPKIHNATAVNSVKSNQFYFQKGSVIYVMSGNFFSIGGRPIEGADPETFEVLDNTYTRDKNHVYFLDNKIDNLNPAQVAAVPAFFASNLKPDKYPSSYLLKTPESVYYMDDLIVGASPDTIQALWGLYFRDANNLYYSSAITIPINGDISPIDTEQTQYLRMADTIYREGHILDASPSTFVLINEKYSKDHQSVYYNGVNLEGVDAPSFNILSVYFTLDRNIAYYFNKPVYNSNPETFRILHNSFAKDGQFVYYEQRRIVGETPSEWTASKAIERSKIYRWQPLVINDRELLMVPSEEVSSITHYFNAYKDQVFTSQGRLKDTRPQDIKVDNKYSVYTLIKDRVFYTNHEIINADPDSFDSVSDDFSRDKNNVFWREHRVANADPKSFTLTDRLYAKKNDDGEYHLAHHTD